MILLFPLLDCFVGFPFRRSVRTVNLRNGFRVGQRIVRDNRSAFWKGRNHQLCGAGETGFYLPVLHGVNIESVVSRVPWVDPERENTNVVNVVATVCKLSYERNFRSRSEAIFSINKICFRES